MNMSFYFVMLILTLHWVADFICQTDWQAKNKSKNNVALLKHVGSYTAVIFVGSLFVFSPMIAVMWTALNGILHFVTDYVTSRITSYLWSKGDVHNFFVVVGLDQLIHYACLFGTLTLMMGLV